MNKFDTAVINGEETKMTEVTEEFSRRVLAVVDAGLVEGLGDPEPGKMCVQAAVCYAMGIPHSDKPTCVSESLRLLQIKLNDSSWSNNTARTKGLRRLAIAQLGSAGILDEAEFVKRVATMTIQVIVPIALRAAAKIMPIALRAAAKLESNAKLVGSLEEAALACSLDPSTNNVIKAKDIAADADAAAVSASYAASAANAAVSAAVSAAAAAAYAAEYAAYAAESAESAAGAAAFDATLADCCEDVVKILIDLGSPGCAFLNLTN